jgi:hypothetical protein
MQNINTPQQNLPYSRSSYEEKPEAAISAKTLSTMVTLGKRARADQGFDQLSNDQINSEIHA